MGKSFLVVIGLLLCAGCREPIDPPDGDVEDADVDEADAGDADEEGDAAQVCGDGAIGGDEACDDGGTAPGDGCDATCRVEAGWSCVGEPSVCVADRCSNGEQDGGETDVDCGHVCTVLCDWGEGCASGEDCVSGVCGADGTCAGASCDDGVMNGGESDVDCGRACPDRCSIGDGCTTGDDCRTFVCGDDGTCAAPTCDDETVNGTEVDVDCGNEECGPCGDGLRCVEGAGCSSGVCDDSACAAPTCGDRVLNQGEVDVDCGGPCPLCDVGYRCGEAADCASGLCEVVRGELRCVVHPHIDALEPGFGRSLDPVRILGTDLSHGSSIVFGTETFSPGDGLIDVISDGELLVNAPFPLDPGPVGVTVTVLGGAISSNTVSFEVVQPLSFADGVVAALPTDWGPRDVLLGDLDGDGHLDVLAGAGTARMEVATALGDGAGGLAYESTLALPTYYRDIALADMNEDTVPDLVALLQAWVGVRDASVAIALGAGDGTFGAPVEYDAAGQDMGLEVGDFDGDGHADVAAAGGTGLELLWGAGDGTIVSSPLISLTEWLYAVAAIDLEPGGAMDLIVASSDHLSTVSLVGDSWEPGWWWGPGFFWGGSGLLEALDADGDGDLDLCGDEGVAVNDGGVFDTTGVSYADAFDPAESVAVADLDGDGLTDVALTADGALGVRFGTWGGGLSRVGFTEWHPASAVAAGDLDEDGRPDLVLGNAGLRSLTVLLNTTP